MRWQILYSFLVYSLLSSRSQITAREPYQRDLHDPVPWSDLPIEDTQLKGSAHLFTK
jgi:hypothetical protein